jgi:hypothetical protein
MRGARAAVQKVIKGVVHLSAARQFFRLEAFFYNALIFR